MGHIVNPIGPRLGLIVPWNIEFQSCINKHESHFYLFFCTSIKKINKNFFALSCLKKGSFIFYKDKILVDKNNFTIIVFLQNYLFEDMWRENFLEVKQLLQKKRLLHQIKWTRPFTKADKRRLTGIYKKIEKVNSRNFRDELFVLVLLKFFKSLLKYAYATKFPYNLINLNFFIWKDPRNLAYLDREECYEKYAEGGGYNTFGKFVYKRKEPFTFEITPKFISEFIIKKLKQRHLLKDVIKPIVWRLNTVPYISGFKIMCSGRFSRAERATFLWQKRGRLSLNSFEELIEYDFSEGVLKFGIVGIKVWICYNKLEKSRYAKKERPFTFTII